YETSCYGFWCCPCFACSTTGVFGESTCLPLVDIIGPACMLAFGVPIIVPPASLSMRVAVRHKYGIQGSLFEDILVSCFYACCLWCQMAREINKHKKGCTFTTTQPVAIHLQPPTMTNSNVSYTTNQQSYVITDPQFPNQQTYVITDPPVPQPTELHHDRPTVPQIKSNQMLFVTYTWLADVNASVAKCLCF
uniref:Cornifelin n=1 Tax=Oncorhynchus tshawytscha TaxID=74940 RepID=A0A8C8EIB0_ONCTS